MSFDIKFTSQGFETLIEWRGLPSNSTCVLEAEPGKFYIKICEPGILFISLQVGSLQTRDYDEINDVRGDSMSLTTSLKKCNIMVT